MKALVPFKVVPSPDTVRFQPGLNRIVREGVTNVLNPLDRRALQLAVAQRARLGGEVVAVTMGPPEISPVLAEVADLGVDRIVHLCDPGFAGADTLATARALAQVARAEQADLIVCGRSAMDGGTAQTPAQVAELLGLPFVGSVVRVAADAGHVEAVEEHEEGDRVHRVAMPVVVSVEPGCALDGPAAGARGSEVRGAQVERWDVHRLGGDDAGYGIRGSRTYVQQVSEAGIARNCRTVGPAEALRLIDDAAGPSAGHPVPGAARPVGAGVPALWVVAETHRGGLHPTSFEGVACAASVAGTLGAAVVAVVLADEPGAATELLAVSGADTVLVGGAAELADQPPEVMAAALAKMVPALSPTAVIAPWSSRGRHYLPRLAARLGLGLTGDFVGLDTSPHPAGGDRLDLVWLKPAWSGSALARVVARTVPSLGTLRPGAVRPLSLTGGTPCGIEEFALDREALLEAAPPASVAAGVDAAGTDVELAAVVLCIGADVDEASAQALREQARRRGWALAGTPEAVARGMVASRSEISLVKRSISPPVFVGVGLADGEDLSPFRNAGLVVTVGGDTAAAGCADLHVELDAPAFVACLVGERLATATLVR